MKMPPIIEIEDDDFLSQVAAVEADALSNKRRKITTTIATAAVVDSRTTPKEESEADGLYTAALKGNNSLLLLQKTTSAKRGAKVVTAAGENDGVFVGVAGGGSCFKCGKPGHWARDCVDAGGGGGGDGGGYEGVGYAGNFVKDESIAEKACPCGLGACMVLTANTERNRGRKFYKCPVREESGGCSFFEWCDSASGTNMTGGSQSFGSNSLFAVIPCPCGAGSCQILTAKTGKNVGQQFYRCPGNQGNSCGFFKWCNDLTVGDGVSASTHKSSCNISDKSKPSYNSGSGSACYKCGKEGHWARDCSMAASNSSADRSRSGTCYKCNKAGHWARDCSS